MAVYYFSCDILQLYPHLFHSSSLFNLQDDTSKTIFFFFICWNWSFISFYKVKPWGIFSMEQFVLMKTENTWGHASSVSSHMHWVDSDPRLQLYTHLVSYYQLLCRNIFHGWVQMLLKRRLLCAGFASSHFVTGPHSLLLPTSQSRKGQRQKTGAIWNDCLQISVLLI